MTVSAPRGGDDPTIEDEIDWQGGPQTIEASQPAAFVLAFEVNTKIKHPLPAGLLAV